MESALQNFAETDLEVIAEWYLTSDQGLLSHEKGIFDDVPLSLVCSDDEWDYDCKKEIFAFDTQRQILVVEADFYCICGKRHKLNEK